MMCSTSGIFPIDFDFLFFLFNWFFSRQIGKGVGVERKDGRVTVRHFTASTRFPLPRPVVQEQLGFPNLQVSLEKCIFLLPGATKAAAVTETPLLQFIDIHNFQFAVQMRWHEIILETAE